MYIIYKIIVQNITKLNIKTDLKATKTLQKRLKSTTYIINLTYYFKLAILTLEIRRK